MCEIQFVKRFDGKKLNKKDIEIFTEFMVLGHSGNSDAYGVLDETGVLVKGNTKLDYTTLEFLNETKHSFLLGHNRYKTKGDAKVMENNHPFETENFVVVHNGVLRNDEELKEKYNLKYEVETDSYIIPALLEHFYKEKDVENSIEEMAKILTGSYSILIYYKPEDRLFYLKNAATDFMFGLIKGNTRSGDLLLGVTDERNIDITFNENTRGVFNTCNETILTFVPKALHIYEITSDEIKSIKEYEIEATYYGNYTYGTKTTVYNPQGSGKANYNHEHDKSFFEDSTKVDNDEDYKKKKMFKEVSKLCIDLIPESVEVMSRGYNLKTDEILLYTKGDVTPQILETLQDRLVEFASVGYTEFFKSSDKGKISIKIDLTDLFVYMSDSYIGVDEKLEKEWERHCRTEDTLY